MNALNSCTFENSYRGWIEPGGRERYGYGMGKKKGDWVGNKYCETFCSSKLKIINILLSLVFPNTAKYVNSNLANWFVIADIIDPHPYQLTSGKMLFIN